MFAAECPIQSVSKPSKTRLHVDFGHQVCVLCLVRLTRSMCPECRHDITAHMPANFKNIFLHIDIRDESTAVADPRSAPARSATASESRNNRQKILVVRPSLFFCQAIALFTCRCILSPTSQEGNRIFSASFSMIHALSDVTLSRVELEAIK